ncbi:MAG: GDP-mannose 4,6-dehydratase [Firmicutes bacterium]|nr:GDP-mannose 4,6-dehydratase [Bacillota bacterium]MCL5039877.1 GDP-mannose 4,6-dehydratase [Bacillota bacterium]
MEADGFWRNRSVLVTGATGLVGSWLVKELVDRGANVVCLIRDFVPRSNLYLTGYHTRVTVVRGALEEYLNLKRILNEHEVETVFHLGAQTIVSTANRFPLATFEANVRGTWNLLEAARLQQQTVRRIVLASSDKAYGDHDTLPYTEDMPLQGRYPYDVSKSCADLIAQSYVHTYGLPVAIARCANIYGGGDLNFSRLVPGTIRSVLLNKRPVVRSNGAHRREYLYVLDAVRAYLSLARALENPSLRGEAFNFSTEAPVTVLEVIRLILTLMGRDDLEPQIQNSASREIVHQSLSVEKSRRILGWRARYTLEDGLPETIIWYRKHLLPEVPNHYPGEK